jgi:hypothetical protein
MDSTPIDTLSFLIGIAMGVILCGIATMGSRRY